MRVNSSEEKTEMIKIGFCIAYDWHLLELSLPLIYEEADIICLSLDKDRISWSGNRYTWDESGFRALIQRVDTKGKIIVQEEDFHLSHLTPMQNEVRQRQMISERLGTGGWHLQLDTDELFIDFEGFVRQIKAIKINRKFNVVCPWITLYKQDTDGFYYVKPERFREIETIQVATKWPTYEFGRRNGYFNYVVNFPILHLSWARSREEIREKLTNWGHRNDADKKRFDFVFQEWEALNMHNYTGYKNLHLINPPMWPRLGFIPAGSVKELLLTANNSISLPIGAMQLKLKNSIWISRFRFYIARLLRQLRGKGNKC